MTDKILIGISTGLIVLSIVLEAFQGKFILANHKIIVTLLCVGGAILGIDILLRLIKRIKEGVKEIKAN